MPNKEAAYLANQEVSSAYFGVQLHAQPQVDLQPSPEHSYILKTWPKRFIRRDGKCYVL